MAQLHKSPDINGREEQVPPLGWGVFNAGRV